jgi:predicted HTH domain antitoxin
VDNEALRDSARELVQEIADAFEVPVELVAMPPDQFEEWLDRTYPID